jgi:ribose-phosphate pyrophosphokinase
VLNLIGDVQGKAALVLDDIIDTAGTLTLTAELLERKGARRILAAGIHGVLSGPALERIESSPLERVLVTDTTPLDVKLQSCSKLEPLSVAPLLGEAIRRIHEHSSVSSLFV